MMGAVPRTEPDDSTRARPAAPRRLGAVLFDMDGTLVDTEPYWIAAEYELIKAHGGQWTEADAQAVIGRALLDSAAYIRAHGGVDLEPAAIVEHLLDEVVAAVRQSAPWQPGAVELLADLRRRGVPCALVTMSYARLASAVVEQLPAGSFAAVVTGDEVSDGKPHPEAYLTAMARLGVRAADCVAIEDSPTGVASAAAAGALVLAVPNHVPISGGPGRVLVPTLRDVTVDTLDGLLVERASSAGAPAPWNRTSDR